MLERARQAYGETNNRFLHDSVLEPKRIGSGYDAGLCVRVLINLRNLQEQKCAVRNMAADDQTWRPNGGFVSPARSPRTPARRPLG